MNQAYTAVGKMVENYEERQKHLQREAKLVQLQIESAKLIQTQFAKQQTLSELETDILSLETELSAKRASQQAMLHDLTTIKSQIPVLTQSILEARAAMTASSDVSAGAAVAAGAAVVAEAGAKSGTESKADTGASATAAAAIHTPSSTDNADDAAETESEPTEAGASEDEDAEKRAGTVTTCTSRERSERGKPRACAFCRKTGHKQNTCPDAYCMRCCLMGHPADYCKNKPCIHCGKKLEKKDHYPINCPLKPTSGRGRGGRTAGRGGRGGAAGAAGAKST